MISKHAGLAVALAAVLAAPAFAQTAVESSSGAVVTSSTGVVVTPGVPNMVPGKGMIPRADIAQASSTTVTSGNTTTTVNRYWVNVPEGVDRDSQFQRWQRLR